MTRRQVLWIKKIALVLGTGAVFGTATCVQNVAETVGTGLALTGRSGVLGGNSQAVTSLGSNLEFLADLVRFSPLGR